MKKFIQKQNGRRGNFPNTFFVGIVSLIMLANPFTAMGNTGNLSTSRLSQLLQQKRITLTVEKKSIVYILTEMQKQTKINFGFSEDLNPNKMELFSINAKDKSIEDILAILFDKTSYKYSIKDNKILIENRPITQNQYATKEKITSIKGKIISEDKTPVIGATVIVAGTNKGAITDEKGEFTTSVSLGDILEISFSGMAPKTVKITNDHPLIVELKRAIVEIEDVVVTGYGAIKRSSFTGNSVVVKRDELLKVSKTNILQALQTFDPSFRIKENNQWGSDPNALPELYIRGESGIGVRELDKNSLTKSSLKDNPNLPTFIMDGFEISVAKLYDMDPNRIESITILKDAAATALYGSRAANGVVVITTVTPKSGKVNVSYNLVGDIVTPDLQDYNLLNAREKLEVEKRSGSYDNWKDVNTELGYIKEYNDKLSNIERGVDTYWLSKPLNTVFNHKHSIYIDGGSENLRFGVDLQLTQQDGVMIGSKRNRYGAGFFVQYNYKSLNVRNHVSYLATKSKESEYGNFSDYTRALPYNEYVDENGKYFEKLKKWNPSTYYSNRDLMNPLYESGLNNFNKTNNDELINNLSINWQIMPYLLLKGQLGITKTSNKGSNFYDPMSMNNQTPLDYTNSSSGELYTQFGDGFSIDANAYMSFNKTIKGHNINAQAGVNIKESTDSSIATQYRGFPSGALNSSNYAQEIIGKPSSEEGTNRLVGFLAAVNYSYNNIYLFDASCRIDGSSAFGSNKRFAPFWSAGVGLNIHNYESMRKIEFIDLFKIRASYGQTGKVNFPAYTARTTYEVLTNEWHVTGYGVTLKAMGNKNLKWETTNTIDAGFEFSILKGFLYGKFSYYEKKTIDLINDVTIQSGSGFTTYKDNIGEVLNRGYEVDLRMAFIQKKEMNLIVNANLAHNKNKIVKISESLKAYNTEVQAHQESNSNGVKTTPFMQYIEGGSLNSIWGVQSMGINPATGDEIFILPNAQGCTDIWKASNQVILGNRDALAQGTFGINFNYKQFSFYTSFMYEFGGQRYNQTLVDKVENVNTYTQNVDRRVLNDRWAKTGDIAKFKKLESGRTGVHQTKATSRFVQDYNMLSWNSISIGYDLPGKLLDHLFLSMVRVEVGANDLLHISSVKQERGLQYPFARTFNFSIKLTL